MTVAVSCVTWAWEEGLGQKEMAVTCRLQEFLGTVLLSAQELLLPSGQLPVPFQRGRAGAEQEGTAAQ
jgi:hypothetical protein